MAPIANISETRVTHEIRKKGPSQNVRSFIEDMVLFFSQIKTVLESQLLKFCLSSTKVIPFHKIIVRNIRIMDMFDEFIANNILYLNF